MTSEGSDSEEAAGLDMFEEPQDYYPPEKPPTNITHTTADGREITLRLVGSSPLWGHLLWQGARVLTTYLESHAPTLIHQKTILELGAGAGLPSLICALHNATTVLVTDYPDTDLIANLDANIHLNTPLLPSPPNITAAPHLWGADPAPLLAHLLPPSAQQTPKKFHLLLLADILFNHTQHPALLRTLTSTLSRAPGAQALVFFTPYRPWLYEADMAFFGLARDAGLRCEKVLEEVLEGVMFEGDVGDEGLRRTVFGWRVFWPEAG